MLRKFNTKFPLFEYPLNHLYIVFTILGISTFSRNEKKFKVCPIAKTLSIFFLLLLLISNYFINTVLFKWYKGYLTIPIAIAFLSYGVGCITSYTNLIIKSNKICELMNKISEMKQLLEAKNPDYKFGASNSAVIFFWAGVTHISAFWIYDCFPELSKKKHIKFWIQVMAVNFVSLMIFMIDAYFVQVTITVRDLFKCFRNIFKIKEMEGMSITEFDNLQMKRSIKAAGMLQFFTVNHLRLHGLRLQINENFGIINLCSVTYTFIVLIFIVYSNVKRYKNEPFEAIRDMVFFSILYGGKLLAILQICMNIYEEVGK